MRNMPVRTPFAAGSSARSLFELTPNRGTRLLMLLGVFDTRHDYFLRLPNGASVLERLLARFIPRLKLLLLVMYILGDGRRHVNLGQ